MLKKTIKLAVHINCLFKKVNRIWSDRELSGLTKLVTLSDRMSDSDFKISTILLEKWYMGH